jgi:hypothetical protein
MGCGASSPEVAAKRRRTAQLQSFRPVVLELGLTEVSKLLYVSLLRLPLPAARFADAHQLGRQGCK